MAQLLETYVQDEQGILYSIGSMLYGGYTMDTVDINPYSLSAAEQHGNW